MATILPTLTILVLLCAGCAKLPSQKGTWTGVVVSDYFMRTKSCSAWLAMVGLITLGCFMPGLGKAEDAPNKKSRNQPLFIVLGEATNYVVNWNGKQSLFSCLQDLEPAGKWRSQSAVLVRNGKKSSFYLGEPGATNKMGPVLLTGDIICLGDKKPIDYNANPWAAPEVERHGNMFKQTKVTNEIAGVVVVLGATQNGVISWNPDLTLYNIVLQAGGYSSFTRTCTLLRNGEVTNFRRTDLAKANVPNPKLFPWDIVYFGRFKPFEF